jgi:hypothetical protein
MGLPVARFRVVITRCSLSSAMGPGMLPSLPNLFQPAHNIGGQASLAIRGSIQNQIAVSTIQRLKPLVHQSRHCLEMSVDVLLFPEPPVRKCHTRQSRYVAALWDLLSGILLKRLHVGIVESAHAPANRRIFPLNAMLIVLKTQDNGVIATGWPLAHDSAGSWNTCR